MPKAGVPQSRARREAALAKAEARRPLEGDERPKSALAAFMRRPNKYNAQKLRAAAAAGELTTIDVQAALAEDIMALTQLAGKSAEDIKEKRPLFVARQRALKSLVTVIEAAPTGGASVLVQVIWPEEFGHRDAGDQVRTKDDDEAPAEVATSAPTPTVEDAGGDW